MEESKTLILCVGLPKAGKSTWSRSTGYPIVCPDEIRLAVHGQRFASVAEPLIWVIARIMVRALFGAGHQIVILDACNTTRKRRDEWVSFEWALRFKQFETDEQTCFDRAEANGDSELMPIIASMAAKFETLDPDEVLFQPWEPSSWVEPSVPATELRGMRSIGDTVAELGRKDNVAELREAITCLFLKLPASIANDVKAKVEAVIGDVPVAFAVLRDAMQRDFEYAWSWHCNIAMAMVDESNTPENQRYLNHTFCNAAAARFMRLCFDVDTSQEAAG